MIAVSPEAEAQLDALIARYEALARVEASINLLNALERARARILERPEAGLPAPRPYPALAKVGRRWIIEGAYDAGARLFARHRGRHLAGNPKVVLRNMPGSGSLVAALHLYNGAPRDGTNLGVIGGGTPCSRLCSVTAKPNSKAGSSTGSADAHATISCARSGTQCRCRPWRTWCGAKRASARRGPDRAR